MNNYKNLCEYLYEKSEVSQYINNKEKFMKKIIYSKFKPMNPKVDIICEKVYHKLFSMFRSRALKEESIVAFIDICFVNFSINMCNNALPESKQELIEHLIECGWTIIIKHDHIDVDINMNSNRDVIRVNHSLKYNKNIFVRFNYGSSRALSNQQDSEYLYYL